jgi:hypothetical protein
VLGIGAIVGAVLVVTALSQIRNERPQEQIVVRPLATPPPPAVKTRGSVELDVSIAQLVVMPAPAGTPVHVDARYDTDRYELEEHFTESTGEWIYRIRFAPLGSSMMALLRVKIGGPLPLIRLSLPRDVKLVITGKIEGGMGSLELGGLDIESTKMRVDGGGVNLSFAEPLAEPMDWLEVTGDKGSIEVSGLGNASPQTTRIEQRFGEIDLDLRGAWVRDGSVFVGARVAGGSIWLPGNVSIEGVENRLQAVSPPRELALPQLTIEIEQHSGKLMLVE